MRKFYEYFSLKLVCFFLNFSLLNLQAKAEKNNLKVHVNNVRIRHNIFHLREKKSQKSFHQSAHGLRTPNEGINQRNLKFWANVADKICFGRT